MEDDFSDLIDNLQPMIREMDGLYKVAFGLLSAQADDACTHYWSEDQVEKLLDEMIGYCTWPDTLQLFKRVCRHYWNLYPEMVAYQVHSYLDFFSDGE